MVMLVHKTMSRKYQMPQILKESDYGCSLCGTKESVIVHHIDQNKVNNINANLIALCRPCHYKFHFEDEPDWLLEFIKKFRGNEMIANLGEMKFHGKLEINFADGVANTVHVNWCVKPYSTVTLTEGGKNGE